MCRRCGAPDRRPGSRDRARLTRRLAEIHGNGVICPCTWCANLVAATPGRLHIPAGPHGPGRYLPILKLERDRLMPGGPYSLWNLVPSCPPCNKARSYGGQLAFPDGCLHGTPDDAQTEAAS